MFYVTPDHGGIDPVEDFDHLDLSRCFGTLKGTLSHPDSVPVTPVRIDLSPVYDGAEVAANDFRLDGLTPVGVVGVRIDES